MINDNDVNLPYVLDILAKQMHNKIKSAGWWHDQITGEDMSDNVYFQATKLGLVHAEVSEALEGLRKGHMDDKLPQYPNEAVECVDAIIRLLDYCGMKGYPIGEIYIAKDSVNATRADHKPENRIKKGGKLF